MNKENTMKALTELGIPHDAKAKAEDLTALLKGVQGVAESAAAASDGSKKVGEKIIELEAERDAAVKELEAALEAAESNVKADDGLDETLVEMVKAKMAAGLSKEDAVKVSAAQLAHDAEL